MLHQWEYLATHPPRSWGWWYGTSHLDGLDKWDVIIGEVIILHIIIIPSWISRSSFSSSHVNWTRSTEVSLMPLLSRSLATLEQMLYAKTATHLITNTVPQQSWLSSWSSGTGQSLTDRGGPCLLSNVRGRLSVSLSSWDLEVVRHINHGNQKARLGRRDWHWKVMAWKLSTLISAKCNARTLLDIPLWDAPPVDVATPTSLPGKHGDLTSDLPFKRLCLMEHNWVRASQGTYGQHSGPYKHGVWHTFHPCRWLPPVVSLPPDELGLPLLP